ncbi:MAG: winged helix-turn-helix domain-containing protein [Candidatus Aminicenantes bacterium]|nr:winged helix-turn-helix domain-containing protein [Candidatus Aminicenantes bacterium]
MIEAVIGSKVREAVLIYLVGRETGYAREISAYYQYSLSSVQNQLDKLESGNVIAGVQSGRTRVYSLNPRYPFFKELKDLFMKVISFLPEEERRQLLLARKRPRRKHKPL